MTTIVGSAAVLSSPDSRLAVISTAFMAAVSIRTVSSTYVPHVSYATFLDHYISVCTIFVALAALLTVVSSQYEASIRAASGLPSRAYYTNDAALWLTLCACWSAWNLWIVACFHDHIFGALFEWRGQSVAIGDRERLTERSGERSAASLRSWHLTVLSRFFCSRRKELACTSEHALGGAYGCRGQAPPLAPPSTGQGSGSARMASGRVLCAVCAALYQPFFDPPARKRLETIKAALAGDGAAQPLAVEV